MVATRAETISNDSDPRLAAAVRSFEAGRGEEAYQLCRQILAARPRDPRALQLAGIIALQLGRNDEAATALRHALAINERVPQLHGALSEALRRLGQWQDAARHCRRAIELMPNVPMLHANLGNIHLAGGQFAEATTAYGRALALEPNNVVVHNNLGLAFAELGRFDEAIASYLRATAINPGYVEAYNNLGNALQAQRRLDAAAEAFRTALRMKPDYATAHNNLGVVLFDQGKIDEATECFRRAITLNPAYADAYVNFGNTLRVSDDSDQAIACYRRALALKPDDAKANFNLGLALDYRGDRPAAAASYQRAIALDPNMADGFAALGALHRAEGRLEEAIAASHEALRRQPDSAMAVAELIYAQALACDWSDFETWLPRLLAAAQQPRLVSPFVLLTQGGSLADQLFCARQWLGETLPVFAPFAHPARREGAKIRLGYLSAEFRDDVVSSLIAELIERHDRDRFEVAGYCYGRDDGSEMGRRLRAGFDRFRELGSPSALEAARQVHADGIDILVDLSGYTHQGRWAIAAHRPAPVQVSYLGYPATMGCDFIDYIVVDTWIAPASDQPFYTERLAQLPECYQPGDTSRPLAPAPSRAECGLPAEGFVFCCFNNSYKITPAFFDIWMRLLRDVPGSVLWLFRTHPLVEQNLRREAQARSIGPERLIFTGKVPYGDYLARLQVADLFLDCSPYNAGATANDALWVGLPVLTCSGESYTGRMAGSLLRAAGVPELVTDSPAAYETLARRLAAEPNLLGELRARLNRGRSSSPLFDMARYTRHLEAAFQKMWDTWLRGEPPAPFVVDPLPRRES